MAVIRNATPLTALRSAADPIMSCNICGDGSADLGVWREHDVRDKPLIGTESLVFIGNDHKACLKAMEAHPRLYAEKRGDPGHFPLLCGPCTFRSGFGCTHPDLKANGGPGLSVQLSNMFKGAILCGGRRGGGLGRIPIVNRAMSCAGQKLAGETPPVPCFFPQHCYRQDDGVCPAGCYARVHP